MLLIYRNTLKWPIFAKNDEVFGFIEYSFYLALENSFDFLTMLIRSRDIKDFVKLHKLEVIVKIAESKPKPQTKIKYHIF